MLILGNAAASNRPATIANGKRLRPKIVASKNFTRRSLPQMPRNANKSSELLQGVAASERKEAYIGLEASDEDAVS
jgi:hypothetical protein